jgi:hypothetical protein
MLLDEYLKAVKELTISPEERLLVDNQKLKIDISNMKSVESQLAAKDKDISELRSAVEFLKNTINAKIVSDPSNEVTINSKGLLTKIKTSDVNNIAIAEVVKS